MKLKAKYLRQLDGLTFDYLIFPVGTEVAPGFIAPLAGWWPFRVTYLDELGVGLVNETDILKDFLISKYSGDNLTRDNIELTEGKLV